MRYDSEIEEKLSDVFVSRDGALWFMSKENLQIEENFYTLYKVEIN
jgi:hypothetical protein